MDLAPADLDDYRHDHYIMPERFTTMTAKPTRNCPFPITLYSPSMTHPTRTGHWLGWMANTDSPQQITSRSPVPPTLNQLQRSLPLKQHETSRQSRHQALLRRPHHRVQQLPSRASCRKGALFPQMPSHLQQQPWHAIRLDNLSILPKTPTTSHLHHHYRDGHPLNNFLHRQRNTLRLEVQNQKEG